ncbi:YdbL family probable chaperone protein [Sphingomonas immobilis]|uniref:YdbL family protein n=1 Tax=Sphingomonas immobilis TaxID=3063997 RepID=A0ABT8ZZ82_9SPHN|nr:YdbL family protein [Sphingomonas sp. CA1-15]MDO7842598.1 YdbL family protein [Sphingomonas sp. CA1-15]
MKTFVSAALIAAALIAAPAVAQRDPAYQAARSAGQVGEQPDGYLGVVGAGSAELRALVSNINIQRKAKYTESAAAGATVEQFAFTSGCNLILKTAPGEKYKTPGGGWATRGSGAPERDSRCV